jgi:6-phosphogluconolactonase
MEKNQERDIVFIGSYADSNHPGIYACHFDNESGQLEIVHQVGGLNNPTFLAVDGENLRLYSIADDTNIEGEKYGLAVSFRIDPQTPSLSFINKEQTVASSTCHISLDHSKQCVVVASYHGGMIGLSPILEDGNIGVSSDVRQHTGSSILPVQKQPRCHSVIMDPSNQYAIVSDLGLDQIKIYKLEAGSTKLSFHSQVQCAPGAGPRHFIFHPDMSFGYVINELNSTVTAYFFDTNKGILTEIQTVPTLPASYEGKNACADIHISPDGQFLYGSNRGHDSIAVYAIDPTNATLTLVEHASTLGKHPRNFVISPNGNYLLAANKDTNNIVTFNRNADTGKLTPNGSTLEVSEPVCLKFL